MKDIELAKSEPTIRCGNSVFKTFNIAKDNQQLIENIENNIKSGTVVAWMMQGVYWGTISEGEIHLMDDAVLDVNLLQELRIFNDDAELYITRYGRGFKARMVMDSDTAEDAVDVEYVDAVSRLWGKCIKYDADTMVLEDKDRKLQMALPAIGVKAEYYGLVTRNYIGYDKDTHQAGYVDYRYVRIAAADIEGGE